MMCLKIRLTGCSADLHRIILVGVSELTKKDIKSTKQNLSEKIEPIKLSILCQAGNTFSFTSLYRLITTISSYKKEYIYSVKAICFPRKQFKGKVRKKG